MSHGKKRAHSMRAIHLIWTQLTRRPGIAVFLIVLVGAEIGLADRFPPDPVEEVRLALKSRAPDRNLQQRVQALRTVADMRRALGLQEWNTEAGGMDEPVRIGLADRFKNEVRRQLKSGPPDIRLAVIDMLAEMGASLRTEQDPRGIARALAPELAELVKSGDSPRIREHAARALGLVYPDPKVAVPPLLDLLASVSIAERRTAVDALVSLLRVANQLSSGEGAGGVKAERSDIVQLGTAILPLMGRGFSNPDAEVRRLTAEATEQAAAALYNQVPQTRALGDEASEVQGARELLTLARNELLPLMEAFQQQDTVLTKALRDPDVRVRLLIARALEELGNARMRLYAPLFTKPIAAPAPGARGAAPTRGDLLAVSQPAPAAPAGDPLLQTLQTALSTLATLVADPQVAVRLAAIDALEALGPPAAPAAPALVQAMTDPNPFVRWSAARTLGKMAPVESATAVPGLARLLFDTDLDVRLSSTVALDRYGPVAKSAVPALIRATTASDAEMRMAAMHALEGIGTGAEPAVPALATALSDPDSRVRQVAAAVLGRFGSLAVSAEPALRKALDDPDAEVRRAASEAILSVLQPDR
jgi:HEAT repeat protein